MFSVVITAGRADYIVACLRHVYKAAEVYGKQMEVFVIATVDDPVLEWTATEFVKKNKVTNLDMQVFDGNTPHVARLVGLYLSTGNYVHFLDDDDYVVPSFYVNARETLQHCDMGIGKGALYTGNWTRRIDGYNELEAINTSSMIFTRTAAEQVFKEIPKKITCHAEDMLYVLVANRLLGLSMDISFATLKRGVYRDGYRQVERNIGEDNYRYWQAVLSQPIVETQSPVLDEYLKLQNECFQRWIAVDVFPR